MITWPKLLWRFWWLVVVCLKTRLLISSFTLGKTMIMCFRAQRVALQNKFMTPMVLSLLGSIIWPTTSIWQFKHYQDYFWWCTLKICYNVYTPILHIHLKGTWSSQTFQNSWQQRGTKFSKMLKQDGFQHWTPLRKLWQNTKLWRWP